MPKVPITNITFGTMTLGYRGYGARVATSDVRHDRCISDPQLLDAVNTNATVMAVADKGVDLLTGTYTGRVAAAQ
jgi:hypothetical protein